VSAPQSPRVRIVVLCQLGAAAALLIVALSAVAARSAAASGRGVSAIVVTETGAVRGLVVPGGYVFRGLPYAAPPVGNLRWRPPQPPARWRGVRDATQFAPSCPQSTVRNPFLPPGPLSEDCLHLNVYTSSLGRPADRPVLVWIHGGGFTQDAARNYDGSQLAADGTVVVTIDYRLGALGFLAHPALAASHDGAAGNYGLMDQQAALRWVQRNIRQFGGDPHNVTIAGESAGGTSVLAQMVSRGSRGLFQRAIIESGAFALNQQPLAPAEANGETFAAKAGCPDQTAECLRQLPVSALVDNFSASAIPGAVDGGVLTEPIGEALAAGRFTPVPVLNGVNHDEELIFLAGQAAVSGGTFVGVPEPVSAESYETDIASVLSVSDARATAIADEYPLAAYPSPMVAFSTLVSDANFVCPAVQVDAWTAQRAPTFAYQFNDDNAPQRFLPPATLPAIATHGSELQYLFDLPAAPVPATLTADQEVLASSMRAEWAAFAANGNPTTSTLSWPAFNYSGLVVSLATPQSQVETGFSAMHHCSFWDVGTSLAGH
jgi:para-nitrobenzyl esterase